tara:strand:+ start:12404 stop:12598 length:195 start_codon:yes stop_codon:yes gene_type:complete
MNFSLYLKNIFDGGEATVKEHLIVHPENNWEAKCLISQLCWHISSIVNQEFITVSGKKEAFYYV